MNNKERLERYWLRFKKNNNINKEGYKENRFWVSWWLAANSDFLRDLKICKWMMPKNYKEFVKKLKSYYGDREGGCPSSWYDGRIFLTREDEEMLKKNRKRAQEMMA